VATNNEATEPQVSIAKLQSPLRFFYGPHHDLLNRYGIYVYLYNPCVGSEWIQRMEQQHSPQYHKHKLTRLPCILTRMMAGPLTGNRTNIFPFDFYCHACSFDNLHYLGNVNCNPKYIKPYHFRSIAD
jgi:hypothetical protein